MFKFALGAANWPGQPNVTVTLFDQWEHVYDEIQQGSFVAVQGEYKPYVKPSTGAKYHNLTGYQLFLNGKLVEPAETDSKGVTNPLPAADEGDDDLPF